MQLINFHPFMHRVRDSTASACFSRTNRILAAYFYLCSKLISLNRINSLSLHFAPRIPKVRRARARSHLHLRSCLASRDFSSPFFSPRDGERGPCSSNDDRFCLCSFLPRASERASEQRRQMRADVPLSIYPSRYVETDVYRRRSTGMPPLRLSLSLSPRRRTPPVTASFLFATVPLVLGLAPNSGGFTHQTALGTLTRRPPLVDPTRLS